MSLILLAGFLLAGFAVGRFAKLPRTARRWVGWGLSACLFALVFILGLKLGGDRGLLRQFGSIGMGAVALAFGCTAGSILVVKALLVARKLVRGVRS